MRLKIIHNPIECPLCKRKMSLESFFQHEGWTLIFSCDCGGRISAKCKKLEIEPNSKTIKIEGIHYIHNISWERKKIKMNPSER